MRKIKIQMLAFSGADQEIYDKGMELLERFVPEDAFMFTHVNPDVLFFITGGSEKHAIEACAKLDRVLLWSHDGDNSNAAATEVKAYLDKKHTFSLLWSIQQQGFANDVINFQQTLSATDKLKDQQLGLIGNVSEWLVASEISEKKLRERFGVFLAPISWDALRPYSDFEPSGNFMQHFEGASEDELEKAARVHHLMENTIEENHLDAITVECFPLVKQHAVTACLSLSLLNDMGIPAGCEGDLTSITGMMLSKALTGEIAWMANTVKIETDKVRFAHCTIARKMVRAYNIMTHYETGLGTAIQGEINAEKLTVFRFDSELKQAFISIGQVVDRPKLSNACRTQVDLAMPEEDIKKLQTHPLGNHHLFLPGDHRKLIELAVLWSGMEVI
ncbi:hypothetical protein [Salinivirga cyanobacteriivorans]|nr:hypothetical protein [Salinivirga cyanobacteriivorans]